jgi:hypothetical protein
MDILRSKITYRLIITKPLSDRAFVGRQVLGKKSFAKHPKGEVFP